MHYTLYNAYTVYVHEHGGFSPALWDEVTNNLTTNNEEKHHQQQQHDSSRSSMTAAAATLIVPVYEASHFPMEETQRADFQIDLLCYSITYAPPRTVYSLS
jgi:hypothetical protein